MTEEEIYNYYSRCMLCPRKCGVNRYERTGFCKSGSEIRAAKAMIHRWEEPVLCKNGGSGAVFFSGCSLGCAFCQNHEISASGLGKEISIARLADIFLELEQKGAQNIDLITAAHYLPSVIWALDRVKHKLKIPVVYNSSGYESVDSLRMLDGYIDIYLPDIKYFDNALAVKYSKAPGYFETACDALSEMIRQTGETQFESGASANEALENAYPMKRGVIVRHMVLPSHRKDSIALFNALYERFGTDKFLISLLAQYMPFYKAKTDPEYENINRRITGFEYDSVVKEALKLGFEGFIQEKTSAKEEYTPDFDLEGV